VSRVEAVRGEGRPALLNPRLERRSHFAVERRISSDRRGPKVTGADDRSAGILALAWPKSRGSISWARSSGPLCLQRSPTPNLVPG